jgi:hypothetical protein
VRRRLSIRRLIRDWREERRRRCDLVFADFLWGDDDAAGGAGVREPRRPRLPQLSGAIALHEPRD